MRNPVVSRSARLVAQHDGRRAQIMFQEQDFQSAGPAPEPVSRLQTMVNRALSDLKPLARLSGERVRLIGAQCGRIEIEAAIVWLDKLARDHCAVEDWDRPSLTGIFQQQDALHRILARVSRHHLGTVAAGLKSAEWQTRIHVALALDTLDRRAAEPYLREALAREKNELAGQVLLLALARAESENVWRPQSDLDARGEPDRMKRHRPQE
ncbi:hypothetical protein [Pararhodobacter marinus]|uniref:hypothetical protein n=2 Tax=Pararhodobacter marinus TaxID=2184063 RepID=UPI0035196196